MCPVYGDKCFMRPAIHVWCTKFACGGESIVNKERPGWYVVAVIPAVDRWDKCLNELGQYVEK